MSDNKPVTSEHLEDHPNTYKSNFRVIKKKNH